MTQAHPLQWPHGRPRTKQRRDSAFKVTPGKAFEEMMDELARFKARNVVVSSNIPTRMDGTPYRDGLKELLSDPGVAVYFQRGKRLICLPCDTYRRPWENIRAIGTAVKAFRTAERHGATQIVDQAFEGFTALPPPGEGEAPAGAAWREVLYLDAGATLADAEAAYKRLSRAQGPQAHLNLAIEEARKELSNG
jgi:hypothetical protein